VDPTLAVITVMAVIAMVCTVITYERHLADIRAERDELLDILDANVDDMRRMAAERHPSARAALTVVRDA
jgi:hypothetical protein